MFQAGEYVVYSNDGLCRIEKIGTPDFQPRGKEYYYLRQMEDNGRIYVPLDTSLPLRLPMTADEAERFLNDLTAKTVDLPAKRDHKTVMPLLREMLKTQTAEAMGDVIKMIRALHREGKIPDEEALLLKRTENRLGCEIAYALQISETEAEARIRRAAG